MPSRGCLAVTSQSAWQTGFARRSPPTLIDRTMAGDLGLPGGYAGVGIIAGSLPPVRSYDKGGSAANVEFAGIAG
jgi:hypothetical protein